MQLQPATLELQLCCHKLQEQSEKAVTVRKCNCNQKLLQQSKNATESVNYDAVSECSCNRRILLQSANPVTVG